MANVLGHVVHDGKIVGYFEYHGSSSRAETVIYPTEHIELRSGRVNECTCGKRPVDVLLWTEYGGGYYWPSQACLECRAIVGERFSFERDDENDGHPLGAEFETEWAKLCKPPSSAV